MMNKKRIILIGFILLIFGLITFGAVHAETIDLEDQSDETYVDLTDAQIKEIRNKNYDQKTYYGKIDKDTDYKLYKKNTNKKKTIYISKYDLKYFNKGEKTYYTKKLKTNEAKMKWKKIVKEKEDQGYWKVLGKKKVSKKHVYYYTWKDQVKVGTKTKWVTKKMKTYESWVDDYGNLYKSKSWNPYKKWGYDIKYVSSKWKYYSDGDICWEYYKVKTKVPIYKTVTKHDKDVWKGKYYKLKLKWVKYAKKYIKPKVTFKKDNTAKYAYYDSGYKYSGGFKWK